MSPRPKRPWSKVVEEAGVRVRLYQRAPGGPLYREVRDGAGRKSRKSLGHHDPALAEQQARALARRLAELRLAGATGPVTLGQLTRLYFVHRAPLLSAKRRQDARTYQALLLRHFGDGFRVDDLSQPHVDAYVTARRSGALAPPPRLRKDGTPRAPGAARAPRAGTVANDLRWLSAVCNWAYAFKRDGRRLLAENPLRGLTWPQEVNPRRPVASEERFRRTLAQCGAVDPTGRLACILSLARYTGRRENAICHLRAADVLLTRDAVLAALARTGQDERLADHMPHGALHWRPDADKRAYEDVAAVSRPARQALEAYLRAAPRVGDAWLFPATADPTRPIDKSVAAQWLVKAERRAGLPKLERGRFHPYRRLFAVEAKALPDVDAAKAAGWRDLRTMKQAYQRSDPATVLKVIETVGSTGDPGAGGPTPDTPRSEPQAAQ